MTKLTIDLADPFNPIAKVREIEVDFTCIYKGDDAWNANAMVIKLEKVLRENGFDIRSYNLLHAWDANHNIITNEQMKDYIYKKHGHIYGKCSSCPDPLKWKEVERLKNKDLYENQKVWNNKRIGRPPSGYNWETGEVRKKVIYKLETQEERDKRLESEKRYRAGRTAKMERPFTLFDESADPDFDIEPKLQISYDKPMKKRGEVSNDKPKRKSRRKK